MLRLLFLIACLSLFAACRPSSEMPVEAGQIALSWRAVSNLQRPDAFLSELIIKNKGPEPLGGSGWTLFFNFARLIDSDTTPESVAITHINGDFYKLEPTDTFPELATGDSLRIPLEADAATIKVSDAPSGFYLIAKQADGSPLPPAIVEDYTVGSFTSPDQTMRNTQDVLPVPTSASRYLVNESLTLLPAEELVPILPTPVSWQRRPGTVQLGTQTEIRYAPDLAFEAEYLAGALSSILTGSLSMTASTTPAPSAIVLQLGDVSAAAPAGHVLEEAYTLTIDPVTGIVITGQTARGVFYGIQSLRTLLPPDVYLKPQSSIPVPTIAVSDAPRFPYRGMHLDVSRNFQTASSVRKLLELMAIYKLNKFHFHLTDDEGWRLEIPGLPELTSVGGRRGHTLDESDRLVPSHGSGPDPGRLPGSGFYSRDEFIEILRYAQARKIDVIPEIDIPGHARAAIVAMKARTSRLREAGDPEADAYLLTDPGDTSRYMSVQMWNDNVIDVCRPSTYTFIEKIVDELAAMYRDAGVPFNSLHTGGDELPPGAWTGSPACAALGESDLHEYFLHQLGAILIDHGLTMAGWEEIALMEQTTNDQTTKLPNPELAGGTVVPYVWNTVWGWGGEANAYQLANAGYKVVLSNATNLYFDLAYDKDPEEPGFYWAGLVDTYKVFSFDPMNLYRSATMNLLGQPIDVSSVYRDYERLTAQGRRNILGIQGQLWSERVYDEAGMEYRAFPKLLGLAERAWASAPAWTASADETRRSAGLAADWNRFANRLGQRELPRLDGLIGGVSYRIPPPGAVIRAGMLYANTAFPGLTLRYTTDGRAPTIDDPIYAGPVEIDGPAAVRAFSRSVRGSRASIATPE